MPQYNKLLMAIENRFGERVQIFMNDPDMLTAKSPDGKWRHGSFEVTDVKSGTLLYTKLGSGLHITEKQQWVDDFLKEIETKLL